MIPSVDEVLDVDVRGNARDHVSDGRADAERVGNHAVAGHARAEGLTGGGDAMMGRGGRGVGLRTPQGGIHAVGHAPPDPGKNFRRGVAASSDGTWEGATNGGEGGFKGWRAMYNSPREREGRKGEGGECKMGRRGEIEKKTH